MSDIDRADGVSKKRLFVRLADGTDFVVLLTITGITTVLVVRAFLVLAGYPQLGNESLHIAHVLWGGLFMLAALVIAVMFVGRGTRTWTAVLGGIGVGLFVDEIGKFVTSTNDYFYRPAAALIYVIFVGLLLLATLIDRDRLTDKPEQAANAAMIATEGLASGVTRRNKQAALQMIEGRTDDKAVAIRALLEATDERDHSRLYRRVWEPVHRFWTSVADRRWAVVVSIAVFAVYLAISTAIYVNKTFDIVVGDVAEREIERQAIYAIAAGDIASLALLIIGCVLLRTNWLTGLRWVRFAVLVNLLFSQIFNFTDSQFAAVAGIPNTLLAYALVSRMLQKAKSDS